MSPISRSIGGRGGKNRFQSAKIVDELPGRYEEEKERNKKRFKDLETPGSRLSFDFFSPTFRRYVHNVYTLYTICTVHTLAISSSVVIVVVVVVAFFAFVFCKLADRV